MAKSAAPLAPVEGRDIAGSLVAVHAQHGTKDGKLKPAHQQFAVTGVGDVDEKSADIRRPPGDTGDPDVQPARKLVAQADKVAVNIARPQHRAVLLAAHPGGTDEIADIRLPGGALPLVKGAGMTDGIEIARAQIGADVIAKVIEIVFCVLGLRLVQPEHIDAALVIIFAALFPQIGARLGIGRVVNVRIPQKIKALTAALGTHQQPALGHFGIIFALFVDGRPYRDHTARAVRLQLAHHGGGIRPILRVELPVALPRPMEKVDHDDIQRNAAAVIFARDGKHLFLRAVAQLTLPQSHGVLRKGGRTPHGLCIILHNGARRLPHRDPIVGLTNAFGTPLRDVCGKRSAADGGIVPQKTVPARREQKWHAHLRIALRKFQRTAL